MARSSRSGRRRGLVRALNYAAFLPLASRAPMYARLLISLVRDERVPWSQKAVLGLAVGYVLSPVDLIPEFIPVLGALDDVAVTILAIDVFLERLPEDLLVEKLEEVGIDRPALEEDLAHIRRMIPGPVRRLLAQLPTVIEGAASMVRESLATARRHGLDRQLRAWVESDGPPSRIDRTRNVSAPSTEESPA